LSKDFFIVFWVNDYFNFYFFFNEKLQNKKIFVNRKEISIKNAYNKNCKHYKKAAFNFIKKYNIQIFKYMIHQDALGG